MGMTMPATKLLIFGDPKGGIPLMLASETIAIDLPLKVLIWEDKEGCGPAHLQQSQVSQGETWTSGRHA